MNIDPVIHLLAMRNPAHTFDQWKKVQIGVRNNTNTEQTVNILQAVMNQSIRSQYPPLNTQTDVAASGGNRTAMSQGRQLAYSMKTTSSTVEVYNDQGAVVASIALSGVPRDIFVDDTVNRAFVTTSADTIDVINTQTNTLSSSISTGGGSSPFGLCDYNGSLAVALTGSNTVRIYNTETLAVENNFSSGSASYTLIGFNPLQQFFYGKVGTGTLEKFDPSTLVRTTITTFGGTISDIRYIDFAASIAVAEAGGANNVYFYSNTTLVNQLNFSGAFAPRFISIDRVNQEILIDAIGTTEVAFANITAIQAGSASQVLTTTYQNVASGYFESSETYIVINTGTTDITLINRKSSVKFTMNGSQSEYDYLVNDIQYNPLICFYIYLKVSNVNQFSSVVNLEISQATGITFVDPKYPDVYVDKDQGQPNYVLIPINGFTFDGSDYISNYILAANTEITMVLYVRQMKRAKMMNNRYLKRYFTDSTSRTVKINTFDTVQTFSGQEISPENIEWGAENNHLLEFTGENVRSREGT